jgi:hypothetical protein
LPRLCKFRHGALRWLAGHEETSDVSSDRMMTIVVRLDDTLFIYRVHSDVRTL